MKFQPLNSPNEHIGSLLMGYAVFQSPTIWACVEYKYRSTKADQRNIARIFNDTRNRWHVRFAVFNYYASFSTFAEAEADVVRLLNGLPIKKRTKL